MKQLKLLVVSLLALPLSAVLSSASARECWSAVGATAEADEQSSAFVVRGAIPGPVIAESGSSVPSGPPGPSAAVGHAFGFQDAMVSLKPSAPAGTYMVRYSVVPTGFFDNTRRSQLSAGVYLQDSKRDRVVIQLKEMRYRTTAVAIDPKLQTKTIAVIDTAFDPFFFQNNVPSDLFVVLFSDLFSVAGTTQIPIPDSPPFIGREFVHHYLEVWLITDRKPSPLTDVVLPTGRIHGPALGFAAVCPSMDMGTCFFKDANFAGDRLCLRGNESIPQLDAAFNDRISSFFVASGGIVLVCEKPNFNPTGWCATYSGAVRKLEGNRNDSISSIMRIR